MSDEGYSEYPPPDPRLICKVRHRKMPPVKPTAKPEESAPAFTDEPQATPAGAAAGFQRRAANPLDEAQTVFIVEGSPAVAALSKKIKAARAPAFAAIGFATFGGNLATWEKLKPRFRDKAVFLIPDEHDEARGRAELVAGFLFSIAHVAVISLPGGDLEAFLAAHTFDELIAHCDAAAAWTPEAPDKNAWTRDGKALGYSWQWHLYGEADPIDMRKWLVESLLPETGTALISGQWGTYKTFGAIDLAAAVMTGTDFIRFKVRRQGAVLFLACEGQNEVAIRITAAFQARGGEGKAPFAWVDSCPRLTDKNAAAILAAMVKHAAEKMRLSFGLEVALVIIDTAGKAAGLTKEGQLNDDVIAKIVMKALAEASAATGALFVGVAHFGKNVETGTKGSTGFEDDTDFVLALLGERGLNGVVANPRLCARKRRSGPNGEEFAFRTKDVELGLDANGKAVTTLTLEWELEPQSTSPKPKPDHWAKSLRLLRLVMMNIIADCGSEQRPFADGPVVRAVDLELIRKEFYTRHPAVGDEKAKSETRRKAFNRAVNDASAKSLIATKDIGNTTYAWLVAREEGG